MKSRIEELESLLTDWESGELDEQGQLDWHEVFADGTFSSAKKGAPASERPNAERVRSGWWWEAAKVFLWEFNLPRRPRTRRR